MKTRIVSALTALVLVCLASTASAGLLNIDINGSDGVSQTPVTYTGTAAAGGGAWNAYSVVGLQDPGQSANLVTSAGAETSVRFDLGQCQGGTMEGSMWASGNNLMDDLVVVGTGGDVPASTNFTLTGLVAGGSYDLYLYGLQGGVPSIYAPSAFTINAGLRYLYNADSFIYVGGSFVTPQPLAENRDYAVFLGLTADGSGTITGILSSLSGVAALNGLQVVGALPTIPEPGTAAMVCLGMLSLVAYAWRNRK